MNMYGRSGLTVKRMEKDHHHHCIMRTTTMMLMMILFMIRSVLGVDRLWRLEQEVQSKLGVRLGL